MTIPGIWMNRDEGWSQRRPEGFENEAALHQLIEQNPDMLPLSGAPKLTILGSEVSLPTGYPDLLGVEASGRPVVIEVKGSWNPDASWAIVAQILAYASSLHGMTREELEGRLGRHLQAAGHSTILDAVKASDPDGSFDDEEFTGALDDHLRDGQFRLVFVLDDVSDYLTTVVTYLNHVTDKLVIDLVAVGAFDVNGTQVIIPQRVALERHEVERAEGPVAAGRYYPGSDEFEASIGDAEEDERDKLRRLLKWARCLEEQNLVSLGTYRGVDGRTVTLLPYLRSEQAGLVTGWNSYGKASISFWRSVFERKAPDFIDQVENLVGGAVGRGTVTYDMSDELLELLSKAYKEASEPTDAPG